MSQLDHIFVISDTHFGHSNVITYDNRPFASVEEHDETQISRWNAAVGESDTVYHLGDFARTRGHAKEILPRLNGEIILIRGNHDDDLWKSREELFHASHEALYVRADGHKFYLSHYAHRVWRNSHHGSFHLHGHSHGALPRLGRSMDVGANVVGYTPISFSQVVATLSDAENMPHHL
jgi:calcineurin-like phosphoesterase family protein